MRRGWWISYLALSGFLALGCGPNAEQAATLLPVAEPAGFAKIIYPADNPTTAEGLALGRALFYDPLFSRDSTVSCATCHRPELAFTDGLAISSGVGGRSGRRNSPSLTNIGYLHETLFWDGRADNLETQALHPIAEASEMASDWPTVLRRLRDHPHYPGRFHAAFGVSGEEIKPGHVGKALAQFQRSLISGDSKYDRVRRGEATFTEVEALGNAIFFDLADEPEPTWRGFPTGECAHCHPPPHFTNQRFFNNGLDEVASLRDFPDPGRGPITGNNSDYGKFRSPGLRNVAVTAPYMHDGRFATLEEVVAHYNSGGHYAENRDPNLYRIGLEPEQQAALVAFLRTLTDSVFLNNPAYRPAR